MSNSQHRILSIFNNLNLKKEDALQEIIRLYNLDNKNNYNYKSISIKQEEKIQQWMNSLHIFPLGAKNEMFLKRNWFNNEFDKKNYLLQFHCKICDIEGLTHFPIRIKPQSRQIKSEIKTKFQKLIKTAPYVKNKQEAFTTNDRICLKLIFVINQSRDKDVDNMAKITIDGLQDVLIPDDKQIDHLEVIKFKTVYLEEHISISIGRSHINEHKNILFRGLNLNWAGLEKQEISKK